ncbi:nucleoside deaminase [Hoeflea sp. CAU 1731]
MASGKEESAEERDVRFMRMAFAVAKRALDEGSHPFGAILVGPDDAVLMEQGNAFLPHHDMTGHAERVLMTRASQAYDPEFLKGCTMYTSAEPCAMCAGAAYWAGLGRLVYGLSEARLKTITGNHPENPTLDLSCRIVFASGQREVDVTGPMLEDEGAALHEGVWDEAPTRPETVGTNT